MALGRLFVLPRWTPLVNGSVLPLGKMYFYRAGTTTAQNIYTDSDLTSSADNPLIADSSGEFGKVYLNPSSGYDYKVALYNSADVLQWTEDDIVVEARDAAKVFSGAFTGTLTGYASGPTGTVQFEVIRDDQGVGKFCTLHVEFAITGTSNATGLTMTGLPTTVQPSTAAYVPCILTDNGTAVHGAASVSGSTITFSCDQPFSTTGFTATGTKALPAGWSISYQM